MSWLGGYNPSAQAQREEKRKQLEADRLDRLRRQQKRAELNKQLQAAQAAQQEADQACQELLNIDPELFAGQVDGGFDLAEGIVDDAEPKMAFQAADGKDGDKALDKLGSVQCPFNKDDLDFWFCEFEGQLELIDVQSQWLKRTALQRFLPIEIKEEVKTLLMVQKDQAGTDIYLRLNGELLDIFGKKPEDDYVRAKNRVLIGKPSQLGKKLIDDICKKDKKLDGCCCGNIVWAMFREQLPVVIRNHISEMKFSKDTYRAIFAKADQVWASNQAAEPTPSRSVAAVTAPAPAAEGSSDVAAVSFKNKGKNKNKNQNRPNQGQQNSQNRQVQGQAGKNKGQGQQNQGQNQGGQAQKPRHPTAKGENLCRIHTKWGVNATFCAAPWQCPMKDQWTAPQ